MGGIHNGAVHQVARAEQRGSRSQYVPKANSDIHGVCPGASRGIDKIRTITTEWARWFVVKEVLNVQYRIQHDVLQRQFHAVLGRGAMFVHQVVQKKGDGGGKHLHHQGLHGRLASIVIGHLGIDHQGIRGLWCDACV